MIIRPGWWAEQILPVVGRHGPVGCTEGQLLLALWRRVPPENAAHHYLKQREWDQKHDRRPGATSRPVPLERQVRIGRRELVYRAARNLLRRDQLRVFKRDGTRYYILGRGVTEHADVTDRKRPRVRARSVAALDSPRAPSRAGVNPAGHALSA